MKQKQAIQMSAGEINSLLAFIEDYDWGKVRVSSEHRKRLQFSSEIVKAVISKNKSFLRVVPTGNIYSLTFEPSDIEAIKKMAAFARNTTTSGIKGRPSKKTVNNETGFNPIINVLIRTSNRPRFFKECFNSIREQTYRNIHTIVSFDNSETFEYLKTYDTDVILEVKGNNRIQGSQFFYPGYNADPFPANLYLNKMLKFCKPGYVLFLDDDNILSSPKSLQVIINHISAQLPMLLWRVEFPSHLVPTNNYFGQEPKPTQIDLGGFAFHTDYIEHCVFDGYTYTDFRAAHNLFMRISDKVFINQTLVSLQDKPGHGLRQDKISNQLRNNNE